MSAETFDLAAFAMLREAFVDVSSLIYMEKAGFLELIRKRLELHCIPEVLQEAGIPQEAFHLAVCREEQLTTDRKLLHCAAERGMALISEDKKLLMQAKRDGLPYYNSLMMLNFLSLTQAIDSEEYNLYCHNLKNYARYSDHVWCYGERLHQRIQELSA